VLIRATNTDGDSLSVREALWFGKPALASDCVDRRKRDIVKTRMSSTSSESFCIQRQSDIPRMSDFLDAVTTLYTEISA